MNTDATRTAAEQSAIAKAGYRRWVICGLLFSAAIINYIDRQIIGVLKPTLQAEFGWSEMTYADIVFWFQTAYAVGYLVFGAIIDRIGARLGFGFAVIIWTIAHMGHAACSTVLHFMIARFALGIGESGNFPAGLKSIAEWFPKRERAFATGIFNAGTNIGAIVTPMIVPVLTLTWGWQSAFIVTGLLSVVWIIAWFALYRKPSEDQHLSDAERAYILSDPPDTDAQQKMPWMQLLRYKETWAYAAGKFLIDPIWWMFLFWLPDFLAKTYSLDLKTFGPPLIVIYLISDIGSIGGGWASSKLMTRGYSLNAARKLTMLFCAILVLPVMFAQYADNVWLAVLIIGLATAAHQGFSANLYTLPSDVFPRAAVASVVGIGGTVGAIGGMLMTQYVGYVLEAIGSYTPIFVVAGLVYLLALLVVHVLLPRYEPVKTHE